MKPFHPVMVRKIKHLTDARYFAAMGVDWMSIALTGDPATFMLWHTLRDWVEGVRLLAEIDIKNDMVLAKTIIDAKPDGIVLKNDDVMDIPNKLEIFYEVDSPGEKIMDPERKTILLYNERTSIETVMKIQPDKIFLQADWSKQMLSDLFSKGYAGGICFLGGDEDMTGVRDYGAMDDMMVILGR